MCILCVCNRVGRSMITIQTSAPNARASPHLLLDVVVSARTQSSHQLALQVRGSLALLDSTNL